MTRLQRLASLSSLMALMPGLAGPTIAAPLPPVQVVGEPILGASRELLLRFLQANPPEITDTDLLNAFAAHFMIPDFGNSMKNEIKLDAVRHAALEIIKGHQQIQRVVLGMSLHLGDYDLKNKRFPILFPIYGASGEITQQDRKPLVPHKRFQGAPRWSTSRSAYTETGNYGCTSEPLDGQFSTLDQPAYLEAFSVCDQNTTANGVTFQSDPNNFRVPVSQVFKLIPTPYPEWDSYNVDPDHASQIIDRFKGFPRVLWADIVFDIVGTDTKDAANNLAEIDSFTTKWYSAEAFDVRPVALFVWFNAFGDRVKNDADFLFSLGDVRFQGPPPGGVVTKDMVGTAGEKPQVAAAGGCPLDLPSDAAQDRCFEQTTLPPGGLYMDNGGHVKPLLEAPKIAAAPEPIVAPAGPQTIAPTASTETQAGLPAFLPQTPVAGQPSEQVAMARQAGAPPPVAPAPGAAGQPVPLAPLQPAPLAPSASVARPQLNGSLLAQNRITIQYRGSSPQQASIATDLY